MPEPKGNLVTPVGITTTGDIKALLCDADGRLRINIKNTAKARAFLNTLQTVIGHAFVKIALDAKTYDPGGNFDIANSRFVAPIAGFYLVLGGIRVTDATLVADRNYGAHIYRNSIKILETWQQSSVARRLTIFTYDVIELAVNDFVELFMYQDSPGPVDLVANSFSTFMAVHLLSTS